MSLYYLIAFLSGPLVLILWLYYYSKTHKDEIAKNLKSGQKNVPYSQKSSANYSPSEKKWTLYIVAFMLLILAIASYSLIVLRNNNLVSITILTGIVLWRVMINLGDKYTSKN